MTKIKYQCDDCLEVHDREDDTQECCPPRVTEVYVCSECEEVHLLKCDADWCCPESDDTNYLRMASKADLEKAGQQRLAI